MSQPAASRLDALTSLRFFAAMMIVLLHTQSVFHFQPSRFALGQGVSFFYVLSGFILTLVYPRLESWPAVRKFWRARFARVWPAYVLALVVSAWLVGHAWRWDSAIAYLAMVQSWIPLPAYFFAYNAPGWSVATEWFFYLAFPLLLLDFERTWKWKLALSFALVLLLAWLCSVIPMSENQRVWDPNEQWVLNQNGVMYIHPLARIFEFVCGMCVALAWRRRGAVAASTSAAAATGLELAVVAACAASMWVATDVQEWLAPRFGFAIARWFYASGSVLLFAALVYVVALGRGHLSRALAWRPLVVGGEISYSMYLLHAPLSLAYQARAQELPALPDGLAFALFLGVVWLGSFVAWRYVEMPVRRLIVGGQLHGSSVVTGPTRTARLVSRLRPALALVALVVVAVALDQASAGPSLPSRGTAAETPPRRHSPGSCHVEMAGTMALDAKRVEPVYNATIQLRGWFLSEVSGRTGLPARMRFEPEDVGPGWEAPIRFWIPRPDVLETMQATGTGDAGFVDRFDVSRFAPGIYTLHVLFDDAGRGYECNTHQRLQVGG
jgi:peptidoglycan/LPS O-acetylase OafA/YrhL